MAMLVSIKWVNISLACFLSLHLYFDLPFV